MVPRLSIMNPLGLRPIFSWSCQLTSGTLKDKAAATYDVGQGERLKSLNSGHGRVIVKAVPGYRGMNAFMCILTFQERDWGNFSHQSLTADSLAE